MAYRFVKSHGLGNDYLVVDRCDLSWTPERVRAVCDRNTGLGSDGLLLATSSDTADYGLRIFNPDGSEAEKSGNGLRIFARYLVDNHNAPLEFSVETRGGLVHCRVSDASITVDMGRATFEPSHLPVITDEATTDHLVIDLEDRSLVATGVSVGNPHAVIFVDAPFETLDWRKWGAAIETHDMFPERTNVQFVQIMSRSHVFARIWERGAGETSASGSSSCAIVAAGVRRKLLDPKVTIESPGGLLQVEITEDYELRLEGPVEHVADIVTSAGFSTALAAL